MNNVTSTYKRLHQSLEYHASSNIVGIFAQSGYNKIDIIRCYVEQKYENYIWIDVQRCGEGFSNLCKNLQSKPHETIIINNCHYLNEIPELLNILSELIYKFRNNKIFIIGNKRPSISFATYKACGHYYEIDQNMLNMTFEEMSSYFQDATTREYAPYELQTIYSVTDGWPAACRLIADAIMNHNIPVSYNFYLNVPELAEYIENEIFLQQTDSLQQALLKISLLSDLQTEIIDVYLGEGIGQSLINSIIDNNLPLLDAREPLKFNPIFRAYLYSKFTRTDENELMKCHSQLSEIYQKRYLYLDALSHAIVLYDYPKANVLMDIISSRYNAHQLIDIVDGKLEILSPFLSYNDTTLFLTRSIPEKLLISFIEPITLELKDISTDQAPMRKLLLSSRLATIYFHCGYINEATNQLNFAIELALRLNDYYSVAYNCQLIADCHIFTGNLNMAHDRIQEALFYSERYGIKSMQIHTLEAFSRLSLAEENPEQGEKYINEAISRAGERTYINFWLCNAKASILCVQGRFNEALDLTNEAQNILLVSNSEYDRAYTMLTTADIYIAQGLYDLAEICLGSAYRHSKFCGTLKYKIITRQIRLLDILKNTDKKSDKETELINVCKEYGYTWFLPDKSIVATPSAANVQTTAKQPKLPVRTCLEPLHDVNVKSEACGLMKINTLGTFSVTIDGKPMTIQRTAANNVFHYLIATRGKMVNKYKIIDAVLHVNSATDSNHFYVAMSALRKSIRKICPEKMKNEYILRNDDRYQLNPELIIVDADEFAELYSRCSRNDLNTLKRLEVMYSGDYMEDFPYEAYLESERNQLHRQYINVLQKIAQYYIAADDITLAYEYYDKAIAADPYMDEIYIEYLRALLTHSHVSAAFNIARLMINNIENELDVPCQDTLKRIFNEYDLTL